MRWVGLLALGAACGGAGGSSGGGDGGNGGDPDGGARCTSVCWAPADRAITATTPPTLMDLTVLDCNTAGLTKNTCPAGFACTGTQIFPYGADHTFTRAVCEPTLATVAPLDFDLPVDAPGKVAVQIAFTLNGAAWPTSPTQGAAGTISFAPRGPGRAISLAIPTRSAELAVELAPGEYSTFLSFAGTSFDASRYPSLTLAGVLTVAAAGRVTLAVTGQPLTYALRLDGATFPALTTTDYVTLHFRGRHGQDVSFTDIGSATAPSGTVMLEPDTYRISLDAISFASSPVVPTGEAVLAETFEVTAASTVVFDARTYPISGAVRVDGADLPANAVATVRVGQNAFSVPLARPARYQGRLFAGTYDVVLDTSATPGTTPPRSATRVRAGFVAGPATLDIAASTATFSGTVMLNGAAPPSAPSRGVIVLSTPGSAAMKFIALSTTGAATWSTQVYAGSYDVALQGAGPLPAYSIPLDRGLTITSALDRTYQVNAGTATLTVLDDVRQPADATVDRGLFFLRRPGGSPQNAAAAIPPRTGPLTVSLALEPGTWTVEFTTGREYTGLPLGTSTLGTIDVVAGGATAMTYPARGVTLAGEVRRGGAPLPPPATGHTRGTIDLPSLGVSQPLPATGPAAFSFRVLPGIYDLSLTCTATCDALDPSTYLVTGIRIR